MSNTPETQTLTATDANFQVTVVEKSREIPVLVDFWAPWCGPCKVIGPLLEKLAEEMKGRFLLVKVNMDENPMIGQALMIRSIPTVKLIINGALHNEFVGALPEPQLRAFLEENLPTHSDNEAASGLDLWYMGQKPQAIQTFQQILMEDAENPMALIGMALHMLESDGDLEQIQAIHEKVSVMDLDKLPDKSQVEKAIGEVKALLFLKKHTGQNGQEANPELAEKLTAACRFALEGAYEDALKQFLEVVRKDRKFRDDAGRLGMLAVFDLIPREDPLQQTYRSQLSSLLFS